MPNQPATPNRNFRCSDDLWEAAQRVAADRGYRTMTDYLVALIARDVRAHPLSED